MSKRATVLNHAYLTLRDELSRKLYESDPLFMGALVGAPEDEYDAEAADLARTIVRLEVAESVIAEVRRRYEGHPRLEEAARQAWNAYRLGIRSNW